MMSRQFRPWLAAVSAALLWGGAICMPSVAETPDPNRIVIQEFMFTPNSLTVKAGATVTWVNMDGEPHTVVSSTGMFRSSALDTKDTFSFKFAQPGTYHFACSLHPRMTGTIVVQ